MRDRRRRRCQGLAVFHDRPAPRRWRPIWAVDRRLRPPVVIHDAKPLIETLLAAGVTSGRGRTASVAAYLLNPARATYKLDEICMEAFGDCPPPLPAPGVATPDLDGALGARARWLLRYWPTPRRSSTSTSCGRSTARWSGRSCRLCLMEMFVIRVVRTPRRFAKELERSLDNRPARSTTRPAGRSRSRRRNSWRRSCFEKLGCRS